MAVAVTSWSHEAILGGATQLPRGPHSLSREQVAASQRARLLVAAGELGAENGYPSLTISSIARHAGVSPNVFYEHFPTKLECFLAAYDRFAAALLERIATAVEPGADWHEWVRGTLHRYLDSIDEAGHLAQGFLIEIDACGPEGRERRRATYAAFAAVLKERHEALRERDPSLGPLPDRAYLGLSHGIRELVRDALERTPRRPLTDLEPDILSWISAMLEGAAAGSPTPPDAG